MITKICVYYLQVIIIDGDAHAKLQISTGGSKVR